MRIVCSDTLQQGSAERAEHVLGYTYHIQIKRLILLANCEDSIHNNVCQLVCQVLVKLCPKGCPCNTQQDLPVCCLYLVSEGLKEL